MPGMSEEPNRMVFGAVAAPKRTTDRNKHGVTFWATVVMVVALPIAYPLSAGPALWLYDQKAVPRWARKPIGWIYSPIDWIAHNGPRPVRDLLNSYLERRNSKP